LRSTDAKSERLSRCNDVHLLLSAYVEGELTPAQSRRVAGHLTICAACRQEEAQYRLALSPLRAPTRRTAPPDLQAGFYVRLSRSEARARRARMQFRWAAAMGALILVVTSGASLWREQVQHPGAVRTPTPAVISQNSRTGAESPTLPRQDAAGKSSASVEPMTQNRIARNVPDRQDPQRKRAKPSTHRADSGKPPLYNSFLDVPDREGNTARELFRQRRRQNPQENDRQATLSAADPREGSRRDTDVAVWRGKKVRLEPALDVRVGVGSAVTTVQGERGLDADGNLALIRMRVSTREEAKAAMPDSASPAQPRENE
jgi:type IV secretory pathway VirB10-like protein